MYGWRGRIGLLVPANNTVIEPEFNRSVPEGVSVYATRMLGSQSEISVSNIHAMESSFLRGARELEVCEVGVIAYACMGTTFVKPDPWADELAGAVLSNVGIEATTASLSLLAMLGELNVSRIAVLTPYPEVISQHIPAYFARRRITVTAARHLNVSNVRQVGAVNAQLLRREAMGLPLRTADVLCILATDWGTLEVVQQLEADLARPIITSNAAILWHCLKLLGLPPR